MIAPEHDDEFGFGQSFGNFFSPPFTRRNSISVLEDEGFVDAEQSDYRGDASGWLYETKTLIAWLGITNPHAGWVSVHDSFRGINAELSGGAAVFLPEPAY